MHQTKQRKTKTGKKTEIQKPRIENILFIAPKHLTMLIPVSHDV